jgi:hypothetical protein
MTSAELHALPPFGELPGEEDREQTPMGDPERDYHARQATSLPYWTPREIAAATPPHVDWILRGYLARQAVTELDGKVKAAGKTTLALHMVAAILDGEPFLGQPTKATKTIFVTEMQPGPFREALGRAGLLDRGDELRVLYRKGITHLTWAELVPMVTDDALQDGYGMLVFDTLGKLSGINDENDSAQAARAMAPLQDAAHDGLGILVLRHDRKGSGDVGESGRGSSAFSGGTDIVLALRRPEGNQPSTRRVVESLSRYEETPEKVVIELTADGYVLLGEAEAVALADARRIVSGLLGFEFDRNDPGLSMDQLVDQSEGVLDGSAVRRALKDLDRQGELITTGKGVKGDPYRYRLQVSTQEKRDSDSTQNLSDQNHFPPSEETEDELIRQAAAWRFGLEPEPELPA